ncbi:CC0125/CC1285 family lipoprotein [Pseudidiomarina sp. E22-M8]|uniref:CC0125/CC1285 family lipoprotein n=1 Tax=Pseudidiomarina sp. E22-M8 TaxID=3424768 RepID=UPI00403CCA23
MMNYMRMTIVSLTLVLAACASEPDYRAAEDGGYGYTENQITDSQYQVKFKARGTDKGAATNYALLRAAEVTLQNDYDWFVITHRETQVDKETVRNTDFAYPTSGDMMTYCNAIRCETRYYPRTAFSAGIHVGGRTDSDIVVTLDIKMGNGEQPESNYSYDASEVRDNLQPKKTEE